MALRTDIDSQVSGFFKIQDFGKFLQNLISVIFIAGSVATLLFLFWGGFEFISSAGNQDKTKAARDKITQAIIGLVILSVIWVLWRIVLYFLGVSPDLSGSTIFTIPEP